MKTHFFPRQDIPNTLFVLHSHCTGDTQYRVWFELENSLTRWKRPFLNFLFREIQKVPYEILTLFRTWYTKKFFALHSHYTGDTAYRFWFDLEISLTRWKWFIFKIRKNSHFAKFAKFRMKTSFLGEPYQQIFCFTLSLHWLYSIPRLVWFGQPLNPMKRTPFFKFPFSRKSKSSVWNTNFFPYKVN